MTITVHIQVAAESPGEIGNDLRQLLSSLTGYRGEPINAIVTSASPPIAPETPAEPKRLTAAERKAAEKAAEKAAIEARVRADVAAKTAEALAPETPAEVEETKQDAKDEASEKPAPETMKLTHDHIRALLGGYVQAYGMENAQTDGPGFVGYPKISDVPDDQGKIAAAVLAIASAIEKNPKDRAMAGDGITAEKIADLKPIVEAAKAVK